MPRGFAARNLRISHPRRATSAGAGFELLTDLAGMKSLRRSWSDQQALDERRIRRLTITGVGKPAIRLAPAVRIARIGWPGDGVEREARPPHERRCAKPSPEAQGRPFHL